MRGFTMHMLSMRSVRMSFLPVWGMRLALPLLFGLAAAYVLTGFWDLREQNLAVHYAPSHSVAPASGMTSWTEVIMEKNILGLAMPSMEAAGPEPVRDHDPDSWEHLGALTGQRPMVLLREDDQLLILNQGDTFKGWKLAEVMPQSAVWHAGGQRREVRMWTRPPDVDTESLIRPTPEQTWPSAAAGTRIALSRQEVQPMLSDPNSLLRMANFKPFTVDGRVSGFQVLSIRPDSLLYRVGLRNGDVLARINGQALTGPTQLLQAYSGMERSSLVTLDVQRASQMLTYVVEIN